jgi:hypothetical protein
MGGSNLDWLAETQKGIALWTVPVPAGAPSRLGDLEAYGAAASPDGSRLPFRRGALVSSSYAATAQ